MQLAEQLAGFPAETVLFGAKVKPVVALESGFTYKHATLVDALQSVMG
jgi:NAD dependent epimerase/dehydratase family enzyme